VKTGYKGILFTLG